ncbi:hypothetical protein QPK87_28500 [Kamptonema cortianum]|nr:hypothetical protein [Geitlerinema splendidum]MDK3160467.1 hypothetical protein [Kamptonema cortianum]
MKKNILIGFAVLVVSCFLLGCNNTTTSDAGDETSGDSTVKTRTMGEDPETGERGE